MLKIRNLRRRENLGTLNLVWPVQEAFIKVSVHSSSHFAVRTHNTSDKYRIKLIHLYAVDDTNQLTQSYYLEHCIECKLKYVWCMRCGTVDAHLKATAAAVLIRVDDNINVQWLLGKCSLAAVQLERLIKSILHAIYVQNSDSHHLKQFIAAIVCYNNDGIRLFLICFLFYRGGW